MYCKSCGAENPASANYCHQDGAFLKSHTVKYRKQEQSSSFCSNCGETVSSLSNYCQKCGQSLLKYDKEKASTATVLTDTTRVTPDLTKLGKLSALRLHHLKSALIPALIAIVVVFLISFSMMKSTEKLYNGLMDEAMQDSMMTNLIASDTNLLTGKLIGVTDIIMMANLQNPTVTVKAAGDLGFDSGSISFDVLAQNGFLLYLLIPFIGLFAAGIYAGRKTRGLDAMNRLTDAAGIAIIYAVFCTIVSLFAGFSHEANMSQMGIKMSLSINTHYSFFKTLLMTLLFGFMFSSLGILFSTNFRRITGNLREMIPAGEAIHQAIAVPFRGILIFFVIIFIALASQIAKFKEQLGFELDGTPLEDILNKSYSLVASASVQLSTYIWNLLHFASLTLSGQEEADKGSLSYHLFSGFHMTGEGIDSDLEAISSFIVSSDIGMYLKFALIIPIVLLVWAGFRIAKQQKVMKNLAIFSVLYAVIMMGIASFTDIGFAATTAEGGDIYKLSMMLGFSPFSTLIFSFIFAYICAFAGSWIYKLSAKQ
ncbi:zinc ribbon domain-containing protein [Bacillus rubiinfantis]|uniref:zinc ribbon domain-containing protein n=1 Tax=Bacillus rubiinfantis TaxID=1499680 RepID=UPI0005A6AB3C|nr:zinc ribbon domain-containing protein [Bacillus rubiinfantis]